MLFSCRKYLKIDSISLSTSDPVLCTMLFRDIMLRRVCVCLPSKWNHCLFHCLPSPQTFNSNFHGTDASYIQALSPEHSSSVSRIHGQQPCLDRHNSSLLDVELRSFALNGCLAILRGGYCEATVPARFGRQLCHQ